VGAWLHSYTAGADQGDRRADRNCIPEQEWARQSHRPVCGSGGEHGSGGNSAEGRPLAADPPGTEGLDHNIGLEYALASRALYTDGAEILYDYAETVGDSPEARSARELVVVRHGQRVFAEVVEDYLHRIEYAPDGYARLIRLPQYRRAEVFADPVRSFGQPIFGHGGARVADALQRFWAGDDLEIVSQEFGVPIADLEDALRVASRRAA
jgi:uncharacterized protein (DUF433 family)